MTVIKAMILFSWLLNFKFFLEISSTRKLSQSLSKYASKRKISMNLADTIILDGSSDEHFKLIKVDPGHIYFVATPIGNSNDASKRMINTLQQVDVICAEDTRHTRNLLSMLGITPKKLLSHHEHNYLEQIPRILEMARNGSSIAVVSDAGTPGISDPGAPLAASCLKNHIPIHPIPGPSAVVSALSVCGFFSSEFTFFGFVAVKGKERTKKLEEISYCKHTVVFFEAPHRILDTLSELSEEFGQSDRDATCCRELTKFHEEIIGGLSVASLHNLLKSRLDIEDSNNSESKSKRVRGEFTIVLGPVKTSSDASSVENIHSKAQEYLLKLKLDGVSRSEAVKLVTGALKIPKSDVYKLALEEKNW